MTPSLISIRMPAAVLAAGAMLLSGCSGSAPDPSAAPVSAFPTPAYVEGEIPEEAFTDERLPEEEFTDEDFPPLPPPRRVRAAMRLRPAPTPSPSPTASPSSTPSVAAPAPLPAPTAAPSKVGDSFTVARHIDASAPSGALLQMVNLRHGQHPAFERVTFVLAGSGKPGWHAHFLDNPRHGASGRPVAISGAKVMRLTLMGIATPPPGTDPYAGPAVVKSQHNSPIVEIQRGERYNGRQEWWLGLRSEQKFTVRWLAGSPVVYIDFPR